MTSLLSTSNQQAGVGAGSGLSHLVQHNSHHNSSGRMHMHNQTSMQQQFLPHTDPCHTGGSSSGNSNSGTNKKSSRHNGEEGGGRGSVSRVPQYTLNDVKFVEELGEGAFGTLN